MAIWVIISLVTILIAVAVIAAVLRKGKPFDTSGSEAHFQKGKIVVRRGDFIRTSWWRRKEPTGK
jgi:hypothetical protein